jgi:hypothetical protein
MDYAINSFDQAGNHYTRWNAREGHLCRAAEVTEAEPSIGDDRVTISHAARRMREEADKEGEITMIGSIHSNLMGMGTARAAATAKANAAADAFSQYLSESAVAKADQAGEEGIQEQASPSYKYNGGCLDEAGNIDKDEWRRLYNEAIANDDYSSFMRLNNPDNPWVPIPGAGYEVNADNAIIGGTVSVSDMVHYEEYYRRIHDDVAAELGLDVSQMEAGSPESLDALKLIGQRIMDDPEGQRYIVQLGLNHITEAGLPTSEAPATDDHPATTRNPRLEDIMRAAGKQLSEKLLQQGSLKTMSIPDELLKRADALIQGARNPVLKDDRVFIRKSDI